MDEGEGMNKQEKIIEMFNDIAPTYDKANRVMSMGVDRSWRKKACEKSFELYNQQQLSLILDVACGTGDMMDYWKNVAADQQIRIDNIVGVDPSEGMVNVGREKFPDFQYHIAKATEIPLDDESADFLSISYGLRNVVERDAALKEFNRVLKQGGMVVILEFLKKEKQGLADLAKNFYMNKILPKVGAMISKNKEAYEYLPNSIEAFLSVEKLSKELEVAGFNICYTQGFSMDISTLLIAQKQ